MKKFLFATLFFLGMVSYTFGQDNDSNTKQVDQWPMFPGCKILSNQDEDPRKCADEKLFAYINEHLKYPQLAKESKVEGMVFIKFLVNEEGYLSNPSISNDIGSGCGDAALAVMKQMIEDNIRWLPAQLEGKNVALEIALPFKFQL